MKLSDYTDEQIAQSLMEAMQWFYDMNKAEGDCEIKYFEQSKEWVEFNIFLKTPWGNFFSGWLHKDLHLSELIGGEQLNRCVLLACNKRLEELDKGEE